MEQAFKTEDFYSKDVASKFTNGKNYNYYMEFLEEGKKDYEYRKGEPKNTPASKLKLEIYVGFKEVIRSLKMLKDFSEDEISIMLNHGNEVFNPENPKHLQYGYSIDYIDSYKGGEALHESFSLHNNFTKEAIAKNIDELKKKTPYEEELHGYLNGIIKDLNELEKPTVKGNASLSVKSALNTEERIK